MQPAIEISGLTKRYGEDGAAVDALKGVDMVILPGEVVGLIGPSGSGKSTLLKCLGAVIEPTSGRMARGSAGGTAFGRRTAACLDCTGTGQSGADYSRRRTDGTT